MYICSQHIIVKYMYALMVLEHRLFDFATLGNTPYVIEVARGLQKNKMQRPGTNHHSH